MNSWSGSFSSRRIVSRVLSMGLRRMNQTPLLISTKSQSHLRSPVTTMDHVSVIDVLSRFVHVAAAIVMVGGTVFMRFILMPAAVELPQAEHDQLRERLLARWKRVVHGGIALLLISGGYNYWLAIRLHKGDGLYH